MSSTAPNGPPNRPINRMEGFTGAGSVRTSSLTATGLSVGVVRLGLLEVDSSPDAEVLVAVECLSAGQSACVADEDGNIGAGNQGRRNFGRNNQGDDNIGLTISSQEDATPICEEAAAAIPQKAAATFPQEAAAAFPQEAAAVFPQEAAAAIPQEAAAAIPQEAAAAVSQEAAAAVSQEAAAASPSAHAVTSSSDCSVAPPSVHPVATFTHHIAASTTHPPPPPSPPPSPPPPPGYTLTGNLTIGLVSNDMVGMTVAVTTHGYVARLVKCILYSAEYEELARVVVGPLHTNETTLNITDMHVGQAARLHSATVSSFDWDGHAVEVFPLVMLNRPPVPPNPSPPLPPLPAFVGTVTYLPKRWGYGFKFTAGYTPWAYRIAALAPNGGVVTTFDVTPTGDPYDWSLALDAYTAPQIVTIVAFALSKQGAVSPQLTLPWV
ncbi:hypothetical protein ACKKBG_A11055 [Auxenochlorella protothecoides x Auxenochlorella symbiontica]